MKLLNDVNYFYYKMSLFELQAMNEHDATNSVSYNSMLYLNIIIQNEFCTVSDLAKQLQVTKSAVTIKMNELEKEGFIYKEQSEKDKRVYFLRLTDKMKKTFQMYDNIFEIIEVKLFEKYTKEELVVFSKILKDIAGYEWRRFSNESEISTIDHTKIDT